MAAGACTRIIARCEHAELHRSMRFLREKAPDLTAPFDGAQYAASHLLCFVGTLFAPKHASTDFIRRLLVGTCR